MSHKSSSQPPEIAPGQIELSKLSITFYPEKKWDCRLWIHLNRPISFPRGSQKLQIRLKNETVTFWEKTLENQRTHFSLETAIFQEIVKAENKGNFKVELISGDIIKIYRLRTANGLVPPTLGVFKEHEFEIKRLGESFSAASPNEISPGVSPIAPPGPGVDRTPSPALSAKDMQEIEKLKNEHQQIRGEIARLTTSHAQELQEREREIERLKQELQSRAAAENREAEITALKQNVQALEAKLKDREAEIAEKERLLEEAKERGKEAKEDRDKKISELTTKLEEKEQELKTNATALEANKKDIAEKEKMVKELTDELKTFKDVKKYPWKELGKKAKLIEASSRILRERYDIFTELQQFPAREISYENVEDILLRILFWYQTHHEKLEKMARGIENVREPWEKVQKILDEVLASLENKLLESDPGAIESTLRRFLVDHFREHQTEYEGAFDAYFRALFEYTPPEILKSDTDDQLLERTGRIIYFIYPYLHLKKRLKENEGAKETE